MNYEIQRGHQLISLTFTDPPLILDQFPVSESVTGGESKGRYFDDSHIIGPL